MKTKNIDIANKRFVRLVAIKGKIINHRTMWLCKCDCGIKKWVATYYLFSGMTKSCGCLRADRFTKFATKHGYCYTRFYSIFAGIEDRCRRKKNKAYKNYGGRGIMCEWKRFEDFRSDMLKSYEYHIKKYGEKQTTIDRIDNNGNYCKENCRWSTRKEQSRNTRNNHWITFNGKTLTIGDWAKELKGEQHLISSRLNNYGWSIERALTVPAIK